MLVCIPVVFAIFLFQSEVSKKLKGILIIALIGMTVFLLLDKQMLDVFVYGILFGGRKTTSLDSISSGRVARIGDAWRLFIENPWIGIGRSSVIDCFFVSALTKYGMTVGTIMIFMAVYPLLWGRQHLNTNKDSQLFWVFLLCEIVYLIGGFFEENSPFGPGVRCYILWFLFGYLQTERID